MRRQEVPRARLTLDFDDETATRMTAAARRDGVSRSRWVAELIRREATEPWPQEVIALAGAWADLPTTEDMRRRVGEDVAREPL